MHNTTARIKTRQGGRSVRVRLLAIALLPTLVILPILLIITIVRWSDRFDSTLISKVNGDLTIAHQYLSRILETTEDRLQATGDSARFQEIINRGYGIDEFLDASRISQNLDFLYVSDEAGRVLFVSPRIPNLERRTDWPIIQSAIAGRADTAIDLYSNAELAQISQDLAARSNLELVPTPNAIQTDRKAETRGMVIHSAAPVRISEGRKGVLVGGILLNQNLVFIDTINDLVYQKESLPEGSQGTATLFLEDVRISTNVRLFEGRRALGTRVSAVVRSAVLDEGETWLNSAFVVNDWYISAYEPIVDSFGQRIGMLYVGFLETPFTDAKHETLWTIALAFFGITLVTIPIFLRWARGIFKPLERMTATIGEVEGGDMSARTGIIAANDEIGRVAAHLDDLLERLQTRDRQLRDWNEDLNKRVDERTRELKQANLQLEATTKQLIMSEKLAAIGEITAGVAHEINNPIAVMQGNLDVLRSTIGDRAESVATELKLLDEQIHRINIIVTKLLQFAKPEEYADFVTSHKPQDVVSDCLPLVKHLLQKVDISIEREDAANREIAMNRTELQQVLINLLVNAIHAMPDGGRLTVRTFDSDIEERCGIMIEVTDTGVGMSAEVLKKVFDPFFTTKRDGGTGLGLSITQTLIERQYGRISVESKLGIGTTFSIWLPEAA